MDRPYTLDIFEMKRRRHPHVCRVTLALGEVTDVLVLQQVISAYERALGRMDRWIAETFGADAVFYKHHHKRRLDGNLLLIERHDEWRFRTAEEACAFMLVFR